MRKFFYRKTTGDIIFTDTLEVVKLNSVAQQIFEANQTGATTEQIVEQLAYQYQVELGEVQQDVIETLASLSDLGIVNSETQKSLQLHTVIMHVIQNCNSPCQLCDCWQTKQKSWHTLQQLRPTIEWLKQRMQNQNVMVSGGEPLMHPEIESIVKEIKNNQMQVLLNTNGLLLGRHQWINSQTVDEVVVSMDGYDTASYKAVRGVDGYSRVWNNILDLKKRSPQLRISLRLILNKVNIDHFEQILEQAMRAGVDRIGVSPLDITSLSFSRKTLDSGKMDNWRTQFLPNEEQIVSFQNKMNQEGTIKNAINQGLCDWSASDFERCLEYYRVLRAGNQVEYSNEPCLFPSNSLVIDYDGGLKPCFYQPAIAHLAAPEEYLNRYNSAMQKTIAEQKCKSCRGKVFCDVQI